jgi:hypothetical protein
MLLNYFISVEKYYYSALYTNQRSTVLANQTLVKIINFSCLSFHPALTKTAHAHSLKREPDCWTREAMLEANYEAEK